MLGPVSLPIVGTLGVALTGPYMAWTYLRPIAKVRVGGKASADGPVSSESVAKFRLLDVKSIRMLPDDGAPGFGVQINRGLKKAWFEGEDARRVAAAIVPFVNHWGGTRDTVRRAVNEIESSGHPSRFLTEVANREHGGLTGRTGYVRAMPTPLQLALEMSLHEEQERRANSSSDTEDMSRTARCRAGGSGEQAFQRLQASGPAAARTFRVLRRRESLMRDDDPRRLAFG